MIREIGRPENIEEMLKDQYGNYVFQKALSLAPPELQDEILKNTKLKLSALRETTYGKKVHTKLVKTYPQLQQYKKVYKPRQ